MTRQCQLRSLGVMKPKEIHDLLLSLFLRGLGIWILYSAVEHVYEFVHSIARFCFPATYSSPGLSGVVEPLLYLLVKVLLAAYFILGAPPFLKWSTRNRD